MFKLTAKYLLRQPVIAHIDDVSGPMKLSWFVRVMCYEHKMWLGAYVVLTKCHVSRTSKSFRFCCMVLKPVHKMLQIVRLRYKSIFMKLFKTTDIEIVKYCQNIFQFELPNVRLSRLKTRFLSSYSSVDKLTQFVDSDVYSWRLCFCWYLDSVSLATFVVYFLLFTTTFMVNKSYSQGKGWLRLIARSPFQHPL